MKKFRAFILILFLGNLAYSQEVNIEDILLQDSILTVKYELLDENPNRSFSISLYSSKDNFLKPLKVVSGDVGIDIPVGPGKEIIWNARSELGKEFRGSLALEVKGSVYIPFIDLQGIEEGMTLKRGIENDLVWSGGRGDNVLNIELYKGDKLIKSFEQRPNIGNTSLTIPTDVKHGANYRFRISDSRNQDEIVYSNSFTVKRKIPLGVKIGVAFVAGALTGYLISNATKEEPDITPPPLPSR